VTLVILMGMARRSTLARVLMGRAWPPATAAAIVSGASLPDQSVWRGTLGELASSGVELGRDAPGVILVGAVAALDVRAFVAEAAASPEQDAVGRKSHVV
jgi:uroporphyrin-III C-methyltransferase